MNCCFIKKKRIVPKKVSYLIDDKNEFITDMFGRLGNLVNIGEYYMFQPIELENIQIPYFERTHPISYKRPLIDIRKPITKSKKSVMRNLMDRLDEYQYPGVPPEFAQQQLPGDGNLLKREMYHDPC